MVSQTPHSIIIDLNHFKLYFRVKPDTEFTLHFNTPSRKFYLSVIALVVHEMQNKGKIVSIPLADHHQILAFLNETVGNAAGSSDKKQLLYRIYRKWKDALPDLESTPLFNIVGRKKKRNATGDSTYGFTENEKDIWANLFDYKGSHGNVRLRFSIDRLGVGLDDVAIVFGNSPVDEKSDAWEEFIASLQAEKKDNLALKGIGDNEISDQQNQRSVIPTGKETNSKLFALLAAVCLFLLTFSGGWFIWSLNSPKPDKSLVVVDKKNPVLSEKPSIAVLPIKNLTGDPQQQYFSDGMTEQIITGLSQGPHVYVSSRTSSFALKGKEMKSDEIAEELGVKYLLEGSVQRDDERVRINVQLIDGTTGNHVWAEHYDYKYEDLFALQDKITMEVMTAVGIKVTGFQFDAYIKNLRPSNLAAYEYYLKALYIHLGRKTQEISKARETIDKALQYDPDFASAHLLSGFIYLDEIIRRVTKTPEERMQKAILAAEKAEELAPNSPPYILWSHIYRIKKEYDKAVLYAEKAVQQAPNRPYYYYFLCIAHLQGFIDFEAAKEAMETGLQLIPFRPVNFLEALGASHLHLKEYDKAISLYNEVIERAPDSYFAYLCYKGLLMAYEWSGNHDKAVEAAENIVRMNPKYSLKLDKKMSSVKEGEYKEKIFATYQKAGLPE